MNTRFEIIVVVDGVEQYLDTYDVQSVPLNFQVSDINEIEKRQSSHSLTINLPETSNNRLVFNNISDLNSDLTFFNPNLKTPCAILVDSIVVFSGNLQLTNISVDIYNNKTGYDCVVYSENDDFFKSIGDSLLSDLDFSELDHIYGYTNIINSWTDDWTNGYYYPLIDKMNISDITQIRDNGGLKVIDFQPATYIKYITQKIFTSVGYKWKSNFFDTLLFENLIFPFGNKQLSVTDDYALTLLFKVGKTNDQDLGTVSANTAIGGVSASPQLSTFGASGFYTFNAIGFNDTNPPFNNSNGLWDITNAVYTQTSPTTNQVFNIRLDYNIVTPGNTTISHIANVEATMQYSIPTNLDTSIVVVRSMDAAGNVVPNWNYNPTLSEFISYPKIPFATGQSFYSLRYDSPNASSTTDEFSNGSFGTPTVVSINANGDYVVNNTCSVFTLSLDGTTPETTPIRAGEEVRFYIVSYCEFGGTNVWEDQWSSVFPGGVIFPGGNSVTIKQNSSLSNKISLDLVPDMALAYNTVLPGNLKQKDFLTSLIKMFNLYIEPSKTDPYTLIVEPRDDYYNSGVFKNWSLKLDTTVPIKEQILAETQNKSTLFTYKKDTDYWNTDYETKTKRIYGDLRFIIENDFIDGEKKIEPVFSPTPLDLLNGSNELVLPSIFKWNNGKIQKGQISNYRILCKNPSGLVSLPPSDYWEFQSSTMTSYPYCGHFFPDPLNPTDDINFGQSYLYFQNVPTNNNLFTKYWNRTLDEITNLNSKIITANFYLTPQDIANFRFNDNIYVIIDGAGSYYKVNKIVGYDPSVDKTTQVELLKTLYVKIPQNKSTNNPTSVLIDASIGKDKMAIKNTSITDLGVDINGSANTNNGSKNSISGDSTMINGDNNISVSNNSLLSGNDNSLLANRSLIFGDLNYSNNGNNKMFIGNNNNDLGSDSNIAIGDYNEFSEFSTRVFIVGASNSIINSGVTLSSTMSFYIHPQDVRLLGSSNEVYSQNVISIGSNNLFGTYSNNSIVIGDNTTASMPNTLYFGDSIYNIVFPTGVTISGIPTNYEEVTITDLNTILIPGNLLKPGSLYKIDTQQTTWKDNGIFLQAISTNQLNKVGTRLFLAPSTYFPGVDGFGNNWLSIWQSTFTPSINDLVIWGGLVWKNLTGSVGTAIDDLNLDNTNWQLIDKQTYSNGEYSELILGCQFDYTNNWVENQFDDNGNQVGISFDVNGTIGGSVNPCDATDWNMITINATAFWNNKCPMGIYNNNINGTTMNNNVALFIIGNTTNDLAGNIMSIYTNFSGYIYGNKVQAIIHNRISGAIYSNIMGGDISNNYNFGDIWGNTCTQIYNNSNTGDIRINSNTGLIYYNSNKGEIFANTNPGSITNNNNLGDIRVNSNNGDVINNSNLGPIRDNSNDGDISNNSNLSQIRQNSNVGDISNNSNTGEITNNSNGDYIYRNSNLGNITDNSNVSFIRYNSNSGDILSNDNNINVIQYNINNGYISNNTGVGGPWNIDQNINNGWISTTALANITDPIVNK